jgi:hypothetical protein
MSNISPSTIQSIQTLIQLSSTTTPYTLEWDSLQRRLIHVLWSLNYNHPTKEIRVKYYTSGLIEILIPIIQSSSQKFLNETLEMAYALISRCMSVSSVNENDNIETVGMGVKLGLIDLAVRELSYRPLRFGGILMRRAFICLTAPSVYAPFVNDVIQAKAHLACLQLLQDEGQHNYMQDSTLLSNLDSCLLVLNSITRYHGNIIKGLPGIIEITQPYIPLLSSTTNHHQQHNNNNHVLDYRHYGNDHTIMLGFKATRLLLRIANKEERYTIIMSNPAIVEFYPNLMRKIMDVGQENSYHLYCTYWKLAGVMMDLSILASLEGIVTLLIPIIPLLLEMMLNHHNGEYDIIHFGMIFLVEVSTNSVCFNVLKKYHIQEFVKIKNMIENDSLMDKETIGLLMDLKNKLSTTTI